MKQFKTSFNKTIVLTAIVCFVIPVFNPTNSFTAYAGSNKRPEKVQYVRKENVTTSSIAIKWRKVKNADGYEVIRNKKSIKRLKKCTIKDTNLIPGKVYSYTVRAFTNYNQKQYYNSKKKKWVTSKPPKKQWKGKRTRKVLKRRYGPASKVLKVRTKELNNPYAQRIPILTFHRIVSDEHKEAFFKDNQWMAAVSDFENQMKYLYENDYKIISIQEFEDWYEKKIELPKKTVVLTFDDGDYELYYLVYPILKKYDFCATAFIVGSHIKEQTSDYIDETKHKIGMDYISEISKDYPALQFQSHTYNLHYMTDDNQFAVDTKSYEELDEDYKRNDIFGFDYIAYPFGHHSEDMIKAAISNGMKMGFAFGTHRCASRKDNRYAISRVKINGQMTYEEYVALLNSYLKLRS